MFNAHTPHVQYTRVHYFEIKMLQLKMIEPDVKVLSSPRSERRAKELQMQTLTEPSMSLRGVQVNLILSQHLIFPEFSVILFSCQRFDK